MLCKCLASLMNIFGPFPTSLILICEITKNLRWIYFLPLIIFFQGHWKFREWWYGFQHLEPHFDKWHFPRGQTMIWQQKWFLSESVPKEMFSRWMHIPINSHKSSLECLLCSFAWIQVFKFLHGTLIVFVFNVYRACAMHWLRKFSSRDVCCSCWVSEGGEREQESVQHGSGFERSICLWSIKILSWSLQILFLWSLSSILKH